MQKGEARCPSLGVVVLAPSQSVTPARIAAFTVLRRVAEQGAYADRALHTEARDLVGRDRAFARQLTFGTIQRLGSLDHHIATLARPVHKLDPAVAAALRLGLYQLLFLDGVPDHAAVTESVELAKSEGESRGGHRLVNAVLRRAARERPELPGDATPADAAIHHSQPRWIVDLWWEQFGAEEAREMLASTNRPAELALRVNTLVTDPESLASALPVPTRPATELPDEGLVVEGPFDAHSHPLFAAGAYQPQSRASMRVAPALDPQPGERILDLCAAPGGKTTHMAARMGDRGTIVSVERHPGRAKALARTVTRLRASSVQVTTADAEQLNFPREFDRVLIDPPCSGLGTLQGHPDLRWRMTPERVEDLFALQSRIVERGLGALRPGGTLVYSTCTLTTRENEDVLAAAGVSPVSLERTLPHRDGTEGFTIAVLKP
jgi:16S rRNA (cytosine967-C5)-methyltransferase